MENIYKSVCGKLRDGVDAVLVTVIQSSGSTPRGAGAAMAVFRDGSFTGTIGGGGIEHRSLELAKRYLSAGKTAIEAFRLSENDAAGLGMICGGETALLFQYLTPSRELIRFMEHVSELRDSGENTWLITAVDEENSWAMATADGSGAAMERFGQDAITPGASSGALSALFEFNRAPPGGAESNPGTPPLRGDLRGYSHRLESIGGSRVFYAPLKASGHVFIFGAGHISGRLAALMDMLFFPHTVIDDDGGFANAGRFPNAREIITAPFVDCFERIKVGRDDYIVILTRGHEHDYAVLSQALKTEARYIGMIGSSRKIDAVFRRLASDDGYAPADLGRISAPIGLPIGGETPEEIALSIAAQLVSVRAGRGA